MQHIQKKLSEQELIRFKLAIKSMMITSTWQGEIETEVRKIEKRFDQLNAIYKTKTAATGHNFATDIGSDTLANDIIKISNEFTVTVNELQKFISDFDQFDNDGMKLLGELDSDKNPERAAEQLAQLEQMCEDIYQKHLTVKALMEQTNLKIISTEEILQQSVN